MEAALPRKLYIKRMVACEKLSSFRPCVLKLVPVQYPEYEYSLLDACPFLHLFLVYMVFVVPENIPPERVFLFEPFHPSGKLSHFLVILPLKILTFEPDPTPNLLSLRISTGLSLAGMDMDTVFKTVYLISYIINVV